MSLNAWWNRGNNHTNAAVGKVTARFQKISQPRHLMQALLVGIQISW